MTVVLVKDLILRSKIDEASKTLGLSMVYVRDRETFLNKISAIACSRLIIDLSLIEEGEVTTFIERLRKQHPDIKVICFGSHVNKESLEAAKKGGADLVLPRSKFFGNINSILSS